MFLMLGLGLSTQAAAFKSAVVTIDGLTCSMCSYGVEQSLRKLDFIDDVVMDLNSNTARITFDQKEEISVSDIAKGVRNAGFSVRSLVCVAEIEEQSVHELESIQVGDIACTFIDIQNTDLEGEVSLTLIGAPYMSKKEWKRWRKKCPENSMPVIPGTIREFCYVTL